MEKKLRIIGLPRVSSKKQLDSGDSVEVQENRLKEFFNKENTELVDVYTDAGKSATIKDDKKIISFDGRFLNIRYDLINRPSITRILKEAKLPNRIFDGVGFTKWDRLSRDVCFLKHLQEFLYSLNLSITPTDDSTEPLMMDIRGALSQEEIRKMKDRVRQTRLYRFEQGIMPGRSPYGYKPIKRDKKVIGFEPNTKESNIVKMAFEMAINGIDYKIICKELNLAPQSYYNIIRNPVYAGFITFEGQVKNGVHEAIISIESFKKLNPGFSF